MCLRTGQKMGSVNDVARRVLFGLVCFFILPGVGFGNQHTSESQVKYSTREKKQMVERAVSHYVKGDYAASQRYLERAATVYPKNYAVPYYLGLIYLKQNRYTAAISQWQRYVSMDPDSENGMRISKYLSLLKRRQAKKIIRETISPEAPPAAVPEPNNAIVIAPFEDTDYAVFGPLGKGMAALLRADLSKITELNVVDWVQLQMVLKELMPDAYDRINSETAAEVRKRFKAEHVVTGALKSLKAKDVKALEEVEDAEDMQISSYLFGVRNDAGPQLSTGRMIRFYEMQKEIACDIVNALGRKCDDMPKNFNNIHTRNISALVAYSWGLEYLDQERYDKARAMFQKALSKDPGFELAEKALLSTPTSVLAGKPTSDLLVEATANGLSPSAAGGAVKGRKWNRRTTMIAGGVAVVAGGAALASGSGGADKEEEKGPNVDGKWSGNLKTSPAITIDIGANRIFTSTADGSCVAKQGNAEFSVSGNTVTIRIGPSADGAFLVLNGDCSDMNCNQLNGTWEIEPPGPSCQFDSRNFEIRKVQDAGGVW